MLNGNPPIETIKALTVVKKDRAEPDSHTLHRCTFCNVLSNTTSFVDGMGFVCNDCWEDQELIGNYDQWQNRNLHIKMKVRGTADEIAFFQYLMKKIDKDWPDLAMKVCEKCGGVEYKMPVIKENEVHDLGKLAGLAKCTVKRWKLATECL